MTLTAKILSRIESLEAKQAELIKEFEDSSMPEDSQKEFQSIDSELNTLVSAYRQNAERDQFKAEQAQKSVNIQKRKEKKSEDGKERGTFEHPDLEKSREEKQVAEDRDTNFMWYSYILGGKDSIIELRGSRSDYNKSVIKQHNRKLVDLLRDAPDFIKKRVNLNETVETEGGFLAPTEFSNRLIEQIYDETPLLRMVDTIFTSAKELEVPILNRDTGGAWESEEQQSTAQDFTDAFGIWKATPHKVKVFWYASEEFLADNVFNAEQRMINHFAGRIGRTIEQAIVDGDGSGKPEGILLDPNSLVAGNAPTTTDDISSDDALDFLIDTEMTLKPQYRTGTQRPIWLMNKAYWKVIRKIKNDDFDYILNRFQLLDGSGASGSLLGYRVFESEFMPASTSSTGDPFLLFGDTKNYTMVMRKQVELKRSEHFKFDQDLIAFKLIARVDGRRLDNKAFVIGERA